MADSQQITHNAVFAAGDVDIQEVTIINNAGIEYDLLAGYLGELNLFEDIYSPGLYGNIVVFDANNINQLLRLQGDEMVRIKFVTPSMQGTEIYKTFKIYSVTDKLMYTDTGKQTYTLHFCSPEIFLDALQPIYKTFKGSAKTIITEIFSKKLSTSRTGDSADTQLTIVGDSVHELKFTSPGWRPSRCINWIASKIQESGYLNPGYMFYESNKQFYFVNIEHLFDAYKKAGKVYQEYKYGAANLADNADDSFSPTVERDIELEYQRIMELKVVEAYNSLKNTQTGYLSNRLYTFDFVTKKNEVFSYDHIANYAQYKHLEDIGGTALAPFPPNALTANTGYNQVYFKHSQLYTGISNNAADTIEQVLPRRTSTQAELNNFKIEITVPGRTDMEVGNVIKLHYPDASPRDETDKNNNNDDTYYSGYYLVTAVRHKITHLKHVMVLELTKDSLRQVT